MPIMRIIFFRSNSHWDNLERFAAVIRVIFGRWTVASAPEYFLLRFFFCFTIDLLYIKASLSNKSRATDSGRITDNWPLDYRHFYNNLLWYLKSWPYRLTVRTPGFHPGNPGSIPGKVTIKNVWSSLLIVASFFHCRASWFLWWRTHCQSEISFQSRLQVYRSPYILFYVSARLHTRLLRVLAGRCLCNIS